MKEVILDRAGDVPVPTDYTVVECEVDFLRLATDDLPLLIRGEHLCAWAEAFFALRGRPYRYQESLSTALQRVFPELSQEQAKALAQKIGRDTVSPEQLSSTLVLVSCYPSDLVLWQGKPSRQHAARWLLWLYSHQPNEAETVILRHWSRLLEMQAGNSPEAKVYGTVDGLRAKDLLNAWLGLGGEDLACLGEFPAEVPAPLLSEVKTNWMKRLIETRGAYFEQMLRFPLPLHLRQELAQLAAKFYGQNPQYLTQERLRYLAPYLTTQTLQVVEHFLPPKEPAALPEDEPSMLTWFHQEYLPYRRWQVYHGSEQAREIARRHAQNFALWYLRRYPYWLLKPGWLSFQKMASLASSSQSMLVLCVILDGLPVWDAEDFANAISARVERLQLQQKSFCFAPVPTITEFAKDALLKGVPPCQAQQYPPLGRVLPENASPAREFQQAQLGDLILWRLGQPDAAYHFEAEHRRKRRIYAELDTIIEAIKETVESTPPHLRLRVIIATDHGRLFSPASPRRLPVPEGMQAHGRASWGKVETQFDETGFFVHEGAGWIVVNGERFGMPYDMVLAWNEDCFQNTKSGFEPYPHGGLFPEEAIVPWFVFERDATPPNLSVVIRGNGEAEARGTLTVKIINPSEFELECLALALSHGSAAHVTVNWHMPPHTERLFNVGLHPWPTKADLPNLRAKLVFRQPSGQTFMLEVIPDLEVEVLYERDESLLKDLGL